MSHYEYSDIHWLLKQINNLLDRKDIRQNKKIMLLVEKAYWSLDAANRLVFEGLKRN